MSDAVDDFPGLLDVELVEVASHVDFKILDHLAHVGDMVPALALVQR